MAKQAVRALKITYLEAKIFNSELVGTEHMLLAILKDDKNLGYQQTAILRRKLQLALKNELMSIHEGTARVTALTEDQSKAELARRYRRRHAGSVENLPLVQDPRKRQRPKSKTPVLDNFGRDLTKFR